ncbi:MAG: phage tail tube protein [Opitutaceae bacterium]|jgi:hypothetical protein
MTVYYTPNALTSIGLNGTAMSAISCSIGKKEVLLQRNGLRATRAHFDTDIRKGPQRIGGSVMLEPSYAELVVIMALAIGPAGNAAEGLTEFNTVVNRHIKVDTYTGCKISRATIAGTQGGIISCSLDIVGKTEVTNTGTAPAPNSAIPFILADMVLTLVSAARETQNFQLVIDNHLDAERFLNSTTLAQVVEMDRTIQLMSTHPYNDTNYALYDQAVGGAAGTLVLNNGTNSCTFTFARLQVPAETPDIANKGGESLLTLNMMATKVSGSAINTTDDIAFA